jgi:hypothetical protein
MRDRKLTCEEAIEEYLVYQIRLFEYLHCFQATLDIKDGKYKPESVLGHDFVEFAITFRNLSFGLFASLMDPQNMALDVFDVWVVLYPEKEAKIVEIWKKIEPHIQLIRDFRNDVVFHANKNLRRYLTTRGSFYEKRAEIMSAMQEFWGLAAELIKEQPKALPEFGNQIEPILKKAVPNATREEIDRLKSLFIQNQPTPDTKTTEA